MTDKKYNSSREWLHAQVEDFLAKRPDITPAGFGWRAVKDTRLVERLRAGNDVTTGTMDAVIKYLANPNHKGELHE